MPRSQVELLRAACCVAGLDREVGPEERALIARLANDAGVGRASLEAMVNRAEDDPNFYHEMFETLHREPDAAMKALFLVAVADGDITLEERVILQHFADKLGVTRERCDALLRAAEKRAESS